MNPKNPKMIPGSPEEWMDYAESDLRLARLAASDESIRLEQICFHTQQAAEKAIKAALLKKGIDFPLTHDIEVLLEIAEDNGLPLSDSVQDAGQLTPYAVEARYPGSWMDIAETDVNEAINTAEQTILWAKEILSNKGA